MKEIVLHTETTGISVRDGHRIVEIGCIKLDNLVPTKNIFHSYLSPDGKKVDPKAFDTHGYSDDFLSTKQKFFEIADDFIKFIKNKKIIIHNAEFDIGHLNNELSLIGKPKINNSNVIDTLELARNKFPGSGISLDALCKRFRIDNSKREKHTALIDCELLAKVYINLIDQREPTLNLVDVSINRPLASESQLDYFKKVVIPNEEELSNHKNFLKKNLKKNYF